MNQKLRIIVDRSLLGHFNTLRKVFRADVDDLLKVDGIGKVRAERNIVMDYLKTEFSNYFNTSSDDYLRMEGIKAISSVWREPKLLGSGMYPDGAIEVGDAAIAIELDHGSKGSHIRNSLAKGAFSVKISKYSEAHVLYFWEKDEFPQRDKQVDKVLLDFSSNSQTYLHLIR